MEIHGQRKILRENDALRNEKLDSLYERLVPLLVPKLLGHVDLQ